MTDYVVTNGVSTSYPARHYGAHFTGNRATFCETPDFAAPDANVLAIPNLPIRVLSASPVSVGPKFFGMHINRRLNDSASEITFGTVRAIDLAGTKSTWHRIEIRAGIFDWTDLDSWVNTHYAAGRDLILNLFGTPAFYSARPFEEGAYGLGALGSSAEPADMAKWSAFCTAAATRYLGKIKYYEVWNEPNLNSNGAGGTTGTVFFFSGTFAKLSEMTRLANQAIKAVDPTAKIISPPITSWQAVPNSAGLYFTNMMAAPDGATGTMKDWVDIIGVHLYLPTGNLTSQLSGMIDQINVAKAAAAVSEKETWDTESAPDRPNTSTLTDAQINQIMGRTLLTMVAKGVTRTMYYQYDHVTMGIKNRGAVSYRERIIGLLMSGTILAVYEFPGGQVAYYTRAGLTFI